MPTIYATLAQIKAAVTDKSTAGVGFPTMGDDNLTRLENAAARTIDAWVGRTRARTFIASSDTTRTYNALSDTIGSVLYLAADLATTPTTVSNNGATVTGGNYKLLSARSDGSAPYSAIRLLGGATWGYTTNPEDAASITGKFAYSTAPPEDIVQATILLVVSIWRQRHTTANVQAATVSMDGTIIFPDGLPKQAVDLLEPYIV